MDLLLKIGITESVISVRSLANLIDRIVNLSQNIMWWRFSDRSARYFGGASMANDEHVAMLKQGGRAWNAWDDRNPDGPEDLL